MFGGDWILLNPFSYMTVYRSECEIVFGGDCFDQFGPDFNDYSSELDDHSTEFDDHSTEFDDHSTEFDDHSLKSVII